MHRHIHHKVSNKESGLYLAIIFPITTAFLITFILSRIFSYYYPYIFFETSAGTHIHHYAYGILLLAVAGYLSLVFSGPRAKFYISLLYGWGLGWAFDEFGMWLRLRDDDPARWSYDGFLVVLGAFFFILSARRGMKFLKFLWPFWPKKTSKNGHNDPVKEG